MPAPQQDACPRLGDVRQALVYACRARKFVLSLGHADLTPAANGAAQDFALGNMPPGAIIMCPPTLNLATQFTGGGATSVGLTIGTSASPTLVATSFNIFGGAASGLFVAMTAGAQVVVPSTGQSLIARVTPDGAHNLLGLTAGALALEVYFWNGSDARYNA